MGRADTHLAACAIAAALLLAAVNVAVAAADTPDSPGTQNTNATASDPDPAPSSHTNEVKTSDENAKNNFSNVNTRQILEKLVCMQIQEWNYKTDPTSVHHIGPTSQDFQAAFGLSGDDDLHISLVDAQGIAMAAIQGLNEKLNAENAQLRASLASLEARLAAIESKHRTAVARVSGAK